MNATMINLLNQCDELTRQILAGVDQVRGFCSSSNFRGDRAACGNSADEAIDFLEGSGQRLIERARGGEQHAAENFLQGGSNILHELTGHSFDFQDNTVTGRGGLVDSVKRDVKDAAAGAGLGLGAVAAGALGLFLALR